MNNGTTIFIPVFNEVDKIENAIRCAAPQCECLLVSDNNSTDGTDAVCRKLESEFAHMVFFQQESNIGALSNWLFLLRRVETPFVMALGSHDTIDSNYVEVLRAVLADNPDIQIAVGGMSLGENTTRISNSAFDTWKGGEQESAGDRVHACIFDRVNQAWTAYGVFRADALKAALLREDNPVYGVDVIMLARIATKGKVRVEPGTRYHGWLHESKQGSSTYVERLVGHSMEQKKRFEMRNKYRRVLFEIYSSANGWNSFWMLLGARYRFMVRIGVFKKPTHDYIYFCIYLPVKMRRFVSRLF